jgi:hypothetical protein
MTFGGKILEPVINGEAVLPGKSNHFIGNDPNQWRTDIPQYSRVRYHDVYRGVDAVFYGKGKQLEYDFILAPGADPNQIRLLFDGVERLSVDSHGDLVMQVGQETPQETLRLHRPVIFQEIDGVRNVVEGAYIITGKREIGFEIGEYDKSRPLIIDPVISYSSFIGSNLDESATDVTVDKLGNAYILGITRSMTFPKGDRTFSSRSGVYDPRKYDIFIVKMNSSGTSLLYSAVIGGSENEESKRIAIDRDGNAYVTGWTYSSDFPTTLGSIQPGFGSGLTDAFVTKLSPSGTALAFSSFLGGEGDDFGNGIAVDSLGDAYITGTTTSPDFKASPGVYQPMLSGPSDAFVVKINSDGSSRKYSTFLGGTDWEQAESIVVDSGGQAYIVGDTGSFDFPFLSTLSPISPMGRPDVFVAKLSLDGSALVYTYLFGGMRIDQGNDIAVDKKGSAYIVGMSHSPDLPVTPGAAQASFGGGGDAFVARLNPDGDRVLYCSYMGGTLHDIGRSIAIDDAENIYLIGTTSSGDFANTPDAIQPMLLGASDAFVSKIDSSGRLEYSSFVGGGFIERGFGIAVDEMDNVYLVGDSGSDDFPTKAGSFQTAPGGGHLSDGFAIKISFGNACPMMTISPSRLIDAGIGCLYFGERITVSSGTAPHTFKVTGGALPPRLTLSSDGLLTGGWVSSPGTYFFTITATDASGCLISQDYILNAYQMSICPLPASLQN